MLEQLVSPAQKQLAATIAAKGGEESLKNNDEMLLELERTASNAPSAPIDDLKKAIFEDPDTAVEKNKAVYSRKFEAQLRQITDELVFAMERVGDRTIRALKSGPHERIRDGVRVFYPSLICVVISRFSLDSSRDLDRDGRYDSIVSDHETFDVD